MRRYVVIATILRLYKRSLLARKRTGAQISLLGRDMRRDVKVKDVHRQAHSCTCVGDIHNTCNVALNRGTGEQQINLVVIVTCRQVSSCSVVAPSS
jgi:hypothetical protein